MEDIVLYQVMDPKAWFSYAADIPGTTLRHMQIFLANTVIYPRQAGDENTCT